MSDRVEASHPSIPLDVATEALHNRGEPIADDGRSHEPSTERPAPLSREERIAAERQRLVGAISVGRADRLLERVAWILSRYPETRDSDQALQFRYWEEYEPDLYAQLHGDPKTLYQLTRLTSLTRARARIQNTHNLFHASDAVRKRRGAMSDEERERFMNPPPADPLITVYADESGKTDAHLVVGSVWFLDPADTVAAYNRITAWRRETGFEEELHFNRLSQRTLPNYRAVVDLVLDEIAGISFKSVSVPRTGIPDILDAIDQLYLELFRRGVEHEHATRRAPYGAPTNSPRGGVGRRVRGAVGGGDAGTYLVGRPAARAAS